MMKKSELRQTKACRSCYYQSYSCSELICLIACQKSVNNVLYNLYRTFFIILYLSHQTTYTILHLLLMPHVKAIVYAVYRYQYILMFKSEQFYCFKKLCNKAFTNNNHCLKPITKIISPLIIGLTLINANGSGFWNE